MELMLSQTGSVVTASSLTVAYHFDKNHQHVMESVRRLLDIACVENSTDLFIPGTYKDSYGREQKCYMMTRDGFSLLAMGFTGAAAVEWKMKYIQAFNQMENNMTVKPATAAEIQFAQAKLLVEQERRITAVEAKQDRMIDVLTPKPDTNWQESMNTCINKIIADHGLSYQNFRRELYIRLQATSRCDLEARLRCLRKRMKEQGCKQSDVDGATKLRVIADDPKLRAIFESIVRTEQIKWVAQDPGL